MSFIYVWDSNSNAIISKVFIFVYLITAQCQSILLKTAANRCYFGIKNSDLLSSWKKFQNFKGVWVTVGPLFRKKAEDKMSI